MKAQTKSKLDWKDLASSCGLVLVVLGLFVMWDPFHLLPALNASKDIGLSRFSSEETAGVVYGLIVAALGVVTLVLLRPAWLESRWRKMVRFCLEAWAELKKVQWPSWSEVWTFTLVVLIAIMAVAIYIGFWDWIFTRVLHFLFA